MKIDVENETTMEMEMTQVMVCLGNVNDSTYYRRNEKEELDFGCFHVTQKPPMS